MTRRIPERKTGRRERQTRDETRKNLRWKEEGERVKLGQVSVGMLVRWREKEPRHQTRSVLVRSKKEID